MRFALRGLPNHSCLFRMLQIARFAIPIVSEKGSQFAGFDGKVKRRLSGWPLNIRDRGVKTAVVEIADAATRVLGALPARGGALTRFTR